MKKKTWIRYRHRVVTTVVKTLLRPYCKWKYGLKADLFQQQGNRAYLILMNHQTPFDQFFVALSFKGAVYYVATEDIFSKGWISSLIRWLVAPISIKKQASDLTAVMNCIKVAREGGTIAMAPEGNRTYSGKTEYMNPAVASLAKKLKLPIALYRIEGGYGVQPRWSDKTRRGKIHSYVSQVIEPEEYASMTKEELHERIWQGLYVDEGVSDGVFKSERRAEYMERALYVCPYCGLAEFESSGNVTVCKKCGKQIEYGEDKRLYPVDGDFPFAYMTQWYDYQCNYIRTLDLSKYTETPAFQDIAGMYEVIPNKRKQKLAEAAAISLYGDRIVIDLGGGNVQTIPFEEMFAASVLGRNKLNVYYGDHVYQFKGGKRFNALKYVNFYYRYKQRDESDSNKIHLGL